MNIDQTKTNSESFRLLSRDINELIEKISIHFPIIYQPKSKVENGKFYTNKELSELININESTVRGLPTKYYEPHPAWNKQLCRWDGTKWNQWINGKIKWQKHKPKQKNQRGKKASLFEGEVLKLKMERK